MKRILNDIVAVMRKEAFEYENLQFRIFIDDDLIIQKEGAILIC